MTMLPNPSRLAAAAFLALACGAQAAPWEDALGAIYSEALEGAASLEFSAQDPQDPKDPQPKPGSASAQNLKGEREFTDPLSEAITLGVNIAAKDGYLPPKISSTAFRVYEDGVEQKILEFEYTKNAPLLLTLVLEWRSVFPQNAYGGLGYYLSRAFLYHARDGVITAFYKLKDHDQTAIIAYGLFSKRNCPQEGAELERKCLKRKENKDYPGAPALCRQEAARLEKKCTKAMAANWDNEYVLDFSHKSEIPNALNELEPMFAGGHEGNLYDVLDQLTENLEKQKNLNNVRKHILVLSTGIDTFSRSTYDDLVKKLRAQKAVVHSLYLGNALSDYLQERLGASGGMSNIDGSANPSDFTRGRGLLSGIAEATGGLFKEVRGHVEMYQDPRGYVDFRISSDLQRQISDIIQRSRNQYLLTYLPTNPAPDGKLRKIEVKLLGPDGKELRIADYDNPKKKIEYEIQAPQSRQAKAPPEAPAPPAQ